MACSVVTIGGTAAIVCGPRRPRRRCACGHTATLLCDWKVPGKRKRTCSRPMCAGCAANVAPGKDLCPDHQKAYEAWKAARA